MTEELKDLSQEEKEDLVDKVNEELKSESGEEETGNTSVFTLDDIDEKAGEGPAQAQYEKSINANAQSLYILHQILNTKDSLGGHSISRKNLIKLIFATLKLPEDGATLNFGGTESQKQACEFAYAQMQLAANTRAFVLGVSAMRQQRQALKSAEEAKNKEESTDE